MKCLICKKKKLIKKKVSHFYFGKNSELLKCNNCEYSFFPDFINDKNFDKNFATFYDVSKKFKPSNKIPNIFEPVGVRNYSIVSLIKVFKSLKEKINILEIGPGFPGIIYLFKKIILGKNNHNKSNYFSIEGESESIKNLQKIGIKNLFKYFPNEGLNKYKNHFDIILSINCFYYFSNPIKSLKIIHRILRKNGIFYIDILNEKKMDKNYFNSNPLMHIYSKKTFKKLAELTGMKIVFLEYSSIDNTPLVYSRRLKSLEKNLIIKLFSKFLKIFRFLSYKEIENHLYNSEDFDHVSDEKNSGRLRVIFKKLK